MTDYDSDFWFSLSHKHSSNSVFNSSSDSVASENQTSMVSPYTCRVTINAQSNMKVVRKRKMINKGKISLHGRHLKGKEKGEFGRGRKERKCLQGDHCFLHFSHSDSERENSDWSELIKCQSST